MRNHEEAIQKHKKAVIDMITAEGWKEIEPTEEHRSFTREANIQIDISDDEVVLIGNAGDFAHIRLDGLAKYTVLGLLHWNELI